MNYNFDEIIDRRGTNSAKFDEMDQIYGPGLMHLGVADMDFKSPEPVLEAMRKIVEKGVFGYTIWPENYEELVCKWMKRRYQTEIRKDWVVFSPRINMALNMAVQTFTEPGDGIILHTPAYTALQDAVEKQGRSLVESPLVLKEGRYQMDREQLKRAVFLSYEAGHPVKMMLLCNPHNPTGRVWSREELAELVEICREYDILLAADEIHADFVKQGYQFTSVLEVAASFKGRLIVCNSVTKTFNVPGVILSNVIIPDPRIRERMKETIDRWGLHNPNIFAAGILEALYTQCDDWICQVNQYIEENYHFLEAYLRRWLPRFEVIFSEGTYMVWISTKKLGLSPEELEEFFIREAKVSVYMGSRYGKHTDSFIRINAACSRKYLEEALDRIRDKYDLLIKRSEK